MLFPPLATPASWKALTLSGLSQVNPIVPPLAWVAGLPSIGLVIPKVAGRGAIKDSTLRINLAFWHADRAEHGIVELLRGCNVVRANKDM